MDLLAANEETGRRICILVEFLQGKPVYESYLNLCNKIGKDTIQFKDFDIWYHRFANGKLDLGYDMSLEPEKKGFDDIPLETIDHIFNFIENPIEKMKLRKVCRNFKDIIDRQNSRGNKLRIGYFCEFFEIHFAKAVHLYSPTKKGCSVEVEYGGKRCEIFYKKRNFLKMAFGHIEYLLKLPNLKLDGLWMNSDDINDENEEKVYLKGMGFEPDFLGYEDEEDSDDDSDEESSEVIKAHNRIDSMRVIPFLIAVLESLDHQLHTKSIEFSAIKLGDFIRILKFLKPGVLETIEFDCTDEETDERQAQIDERQAQIVYESEQWRLAVERFISVDFNSSLLFLLHSDTIRIRLWKLIPDEIVRIREIIYTHPNFKHCCISSFDFCLSREFSFEDIYSALGSYTEISNSPTKRAYKLPDSEGTLEFKFEFDSLQRGRITIDMRKLT